MVTIVTVLKVDELGQMWFFVPKPQQALHEFDGEFQLHSWMFNTAVVIARGIAFEFLPVRVSN